MAVVAVSPFSAQLRAWRQARGVSQLALALEAGTTSRHVSFLETGRSRPTSDMVLRLAAALGLPLRDRNRLLEAAGLPPHFVEAPLERELLAPYRAAVERLLQAHEPYPALVADRVWNVVAANDACATLFGGDLLGQNLVRRWADSHDAIENWPEVAGAALAHLHRQLRATPNDEALRELAQLIADAAPMTAELSSSGAELVVCPRFRVGDTVLRTTVLAARFDHPLEVTLEELRIELIYPLDSATADFFRAASAKT